MHGQIDRLVRFCIPVNALFRCQVREKVEFGTGFDALILEMDRLNVLRTGFAANEPQPWNFHPCNGPDHHRTTQCV
jgi:hypothetical protein